MKMTKADYAEYVRKKSPDSRTGRNLFRAFLVGGVICCIGQAVSDGYGCLALSETAAATATSMTMVFLGALLTALGFYDRLAKFAGAGTLVPITGFANAVAAPALEFRSEGLVTGTAVKMFTIAGPVIVFGTLAGTAYGIVLVLIGIN